MYDYYHVEAGIEKYIGIHPDILKLKNITYCHGNLIIDNELEIINQISHHHPLTKNQSVLKRRVNDAYEPDDFKHEMMLVIHDEIHVLCGGCAHNGILNIMESVNQPIDIVVSGFHLKQKNYSTQDLCMIEQLGKQLLQYPCKYYSGHCTGPIAYDVLKHVMKEQLDHLYTGKIIKF